MKNAKSKNTLLTVLFWVGATLLLVVIAGGFTRLHIGNQTTKLLFGLADGGLGYLENDWMSNTKDPLPVFSWLVKVTYQYLDIRLIFVYQAVLMGIYFYSLVMIADHVFDIGRTRLLFFIFLVVFYATFSGLWPGAIRNLLHDGVAEQGFSFYHFLPNAFMAFLFLSILLFLKEKPYWAVFSVAVASYFHTGYLIGGAALVSAYLLIDFWEKRDFKRVLFIGGAALLMVSPIVVYNFFANQNAASAQVAEATRIVTNLRIPHHTQVTEWWGDNAFLKVVLVLGAMLVTRRTKLFPILLVSFLFAALPTIAMFIRPSNTIAILQLWRVSVVTVPLATVALVAAMSSSIYEAEETGINRWRWGLVLILSGLLAVLVVFGANKQILKIEEGYNLPGYAMMEYVAEHGGSDQQYLTPPAGYSLMKSFRLLTGQPVFVNWKTHPWNAVELLEWYHRIEVADKFYAAEDSSQCALLEELENDYGITHVLIPVEDSLDCEGVELNHETEWFYLYQIQQEE